MKSLIRCAVPALLSMFIAGQAQAQNINPAETSNFYGSTKGWDVFSYTHNYDGFVGCRAIKSGRAGQLAIGYVGGNRSANSGRWELSIPTTQRERFGGGVLAVGKYDFDVQFGFADGFATRQLSPAELKYIKSGSDLLIDINGDVSRSWSLAGSTAATLKAYECRANGGISPVRNAQNQAATNVRPKNPVTPQVASNQTPGSQIGNPLVGNCSSVFGGSYRCMVTNFVPNPGEREVYQVEDAFGQQPGYFIRIGGNGEKSVWISHNKAAWQPIGFWQDIPGRKGCMRPSPVQSQVARDNLGQDAWELCVGG